MRIFGRYSPEEMGILVRMAQPSTKRMAGLAAGLLVVTVAFGAAGGKLVARWRLHELHSLVGEVGRADPADLSELLVKAKISATALRDRPETALLLAHACAAASARHPRQRGFLGNRLALLAGLGRELDALPALAGEAFRMESFALAEDGRFREANEALALAESRLRPFSSGSAGKALALSMINEKAYFLATADEGEFRDPKQALRLAKALIASRDEVEPGRFASGYAAFVDTLAAAWFASGEPGRALDAQNMALGLAEGEELSIYLEHYDEYAAAAGRK